MDKLWKQALAAMAVGFLVPQLVFSAGEWMEPEVPQPEETAAVPETAAPTVSTQTAAVLYLPVILSDGSTVFMELEEYVLGVVLAEMPASFEDEALKAQAVAARTYTLRRLYLGDKHAQGAVCADYRCCQAYLSVEEYLRSRGTAADVEKVSRAVSATAGQVLTYNGKLIEATYFACSGGRTEDALAVWGEEIPYLQAVDSPGEVKGECYDREIYFSALEFAAALGRELSGSPESWLGEVTLTAGGGVDTMVIAGKSYSGVRLRELLELNSTVFTMTATQRGIYVQTTGWGHRVGLSQYGADAMAMQGSDYQQILAYYYRGTRIDKWNELG